MLLGSFDGRLACPNCRKKEKDKTMREVLQEKEKGLPCAGKGIFSNQEPNGSG